MLESMSKDEVLQKLALHKPILVARYGVKTLALFGSHARNGATPESDIDVLVGFSEAATFKSYFGVQFYLEDLFGMPIDLVTDKALRPEFRAFVEGELLAV